MSFARKRMEPSYLGCYILILSRVFFGAEAQKLRKLGSTLNPEGIALYSPRLPSNSEATLGLIAAKIQPQRGCATSCVWPSPCATALRLMLAFNVGPKVARVRATLGFRAESRWDSYGFSRML